MPKATFLVIMLTTDRDYDNAMRTALRLIDKLKDVNSPRCAGELQTLYLSLGDTQMMLERHHEAAQSYAEAYKWVFVIPLHQNSDTIFLPNIYKS